MKIRLLRYFPLAIVFACLGINQAGAADVEMYAVLKGQLLVQTNAGTPVAESDSSYVFETFVESNEDGEDDTLTNVTLRLPNDTLVSIPDDDGYHFKNTFASSGALDGAYPDGIYAVITEGVNDGIRTNLLDLTGGAYPSTPRFSNFTQAQAIDPEVEFVLSWDPIAGGTTNDFIILNINGDGDDDEILETPGPGQPGALNGLSTSVTINAYRMRPGQTYTAELLLGRPSTFDTQSYPGANGLAAHFKRLQMQLVTTGEQTGSPPGAFNMVFNFSHGFFGAGTNGVIQFPQGLSYYFALFNIDDTNYPETVTFSGPPGSGLSNTTNHHGGSSSGSAFYSSPSINTPPFPPGGVYTINYKGTDLKWNILDPNAANQQVLIVPTVVVDSSNVLKQINWTYKDPSGNSIPAQPFMESIGIAVEGIGGRLYDIYTGNESGLDPAETNHVLSSSVIWTNVSMIFMYFADVRGNQYSSYWGRSMVPPEITTVTVPNGAVGSTYSFLMSASGGTSQFSWSIESGALPNGLSLTAATGEIFGTPTQAGTNNFVVRVTDTASSSTNRAFSMVVAPNSAPSFSSFGRLLNGEFEMLLSGESGKTYRFESSTNLIHWMELQTSAAPTGTVNFRDTNAPAWNKRFYRAVLVP